MLSNGYNNWLGTACLRGVPMCVLLWQSICMCACRFINDCTCELMLCACRVVCHSLHVSPHPLVFVQCNICICLCSSLYRFFVSDQQSAADIFSGCCDWRGRKRHEGIAPANLEKHESFSVMLFQPSLPPRHACHGSHSTFWLMTSAIVGPHAYDLLIKFVFTPKELVRHTAVTHDMYVAPPQTVQSKMLSFCILLEQI